MKKKLFFIAALFITSSVSAQSTAQDWTKTDCDGNSHNLFTDLDAGKVVVMEFAMQCNSCATAANALENIKMAYNNSNTGKVDFYLMDYVGNTCSSINSWITSYGYTMTGIDNCSTEKNYYSTGMPMPMIVVVGNNIHKVYYKKTSFSNSDTTNIRNAIDLAIAGVTGIEEKQNGRNTIAIYPNSSDRDALIQYALKEAMHVQIEIYNILGEKVQIVASEKQNAGKHEIKLNTSVLSNGIYFLKVNGDMLKFQISN